MGTNYYTTSGIDKCPHCGRGEDRIHIGKASAGWKFLFAPHEPKGLMTKAAWRAFLEAGEIVDEYGAVWAVSDFWEMVERQQKPSLLDADNAPESAYGFGDRSKIERKDAEGYRFSLTSDFF